MTIIYDSMLNSIYVEITPIKAKFSDPANSTRLYIRLGGDNLSSTASIHWELRDENTNLYESNTLFISGTDYTNWDGTNEALFTYTVTILNLTITT